MTGFIKAIYNALINSTGIRLGVFPTSADGAAAAAITIAAAAVAWTFGAWTQVVLAAGVTVDQQIWGVSLENFVGAATQGEVEIGFGVAPAGTLLAKVPLVGNVYYFPKPVKLAAGNGIVARYRTATGVADSVDVKVLSSTGF